jgi:imidazole glycerol-phosphate synthase subunit HisH
MSVIKVGIVDYQSGNVRSVSNAIEHAGGDVVLVRTPEDLSFCSHLVLPGVGAFGFCAERLRASGLMPALEHWTFTDQKPLLGICVGMQLMADGSDEQGDHPGLGWMGGRVRKLEVNGRDSIRVPHVGWNEVVFREPLGVIAEGEAPNFYFDHSHAYDAPSLGREVGACWHGRSFSAVIRRENIVAVQFHPEKSQTAGMRLLQSFFAI